MTHTDLFFELENVTHIYQGGEAEGHEALRGITLSITAGNSSRYSERTALGNQHSHVI